MCMYLWMCWLAQCVSVTLHTCMCLYLCIFLIHIWYVILFPFYPKREKKNTFIPFPFPNPPRCSRMILPSKIHKPKKTHKIEEKENNRRKQQIEEYIVCSMQMRWKYLHFLIQHEITVIAPNINAASAHHAMDYDEVTITMGMYRKCTQNRRKWK